MMNRNKSTTDNKKVYNQWAIMLDASVTNGVCWQISFLCKYKDTYTIEVGTTTYGGWGFGPPYSVKSTKINPREKITLSEVKFACWQITPEMCAQKIEKILNAEKSKNLDKYHIYNGPQYDFGAFEYLSLPEELIQELKGKNRKRN